MKISRKKECFTGAFESLKIEKKRAKKLTFSSYLDTLVITGRFANFNFPRGYRENWHFWGGEDFAQFFIVRYYGCRGKKIAFLTREKKGILGKKIALIFWHIVV